MPELPEVEVLRRHLARILPGKVVRRVQVCRERVIKPDSLARLRNALAGATFTEISRRGKYLLFKFRKTGRVFDLLGHLGMTGRFYVQPAAAKLPKHTALWLDLGREHFVFEDTRYFGRFTLDVSGVSALGPEPLESDFTVARLSAALKRSNQPIKVKLLDQSVVAGIGNIYASEALFHARISPLKPSKALSPLQLRALRRAIRAVLREAIRSGSTIPLNFGPNPEDDALFYFGRQSGSPDFYEERLRVYDRAGQPCIRCRKPIRRTVQAARSTYYCPSCQK